jgi:hypothetical protein
VIAALNCRPVTPVGGDRRDASAHRHPQRGQLGWTSDRLQQEWGILREELDRLIRLHSRELLEPALAEAMRVIERMISQAVETSLRALERTRLDRAPGAPAG